MVRYFYAWTPLVIVGTVFVLALPWLGLFALTAASLVVVVALAALAWAIVFVPYILGRAIGHLAPTWRESTDGRGPVTDRARRRVARPGKNV